MIEPYSDVFAEFAEAARKGIKRFTSVKELGGGQQGIILADMPPVRIEAAPVFDVGFLRDLSTGRALALDTYNALVVEGDRRLHEGTFRLPFPDCWFIVWFSDGGGTRYPTVNLLHAIELDDGGLHVSPYFRCFDAPGDMGKWTQQCTQMLWHPELGLATTTNTDFQSEYWFNEHKEDAEVAFINVLVSTLVLERHPGARYAATTDFQKRINVGRERGHLAPLPQVLLIDLSKYPPPFDPEPSIGGTKRPHDRRGHYRKLSSGKIVSVRSSKIHGAAAAPPNYRVRW